MKPIDILKGWGPTRSHKHTAGSDEFTVTVQAPKFMQQPPRSVVLNRDQYDRYVKWLKENTLIQNVLPDLSLDDREILMSGLGSDLGGLIDDHD